MVDFSFNAYSTPLLFGFFQGWVYAVLFWLRAWRQERLSDALFGALLMVMAFEIWEYMLGFGGVEILWQQLEFFPRNFSLLLPPLAYFYLKSQLNTDLRLRWRDLLHALPFLIHALYHLLVFAQGAAFVSDWKEDVHQPWRLDMVELGAIYSLQIVYFFKSYRLYQQYRRWMPNQFSDLERVSFAWFRNFLIAYVLSSVAGWVMTLTDLWLQLDFWHDWWDELFNAGLIYYLAITGYAQAQPRGIHFEPESQEEKPENVKNERLPDAELALWKTRLEQAMSEEKLYLNPDLSLPDLARHLQTNASVLSAVINSAYGKNFNDFINTYRVEAVKAMLKSPEAQLYSLLGIGLECGFNSKSTFNRAFKKATGKSPGEYTT